MTEEMELARYVKEFWRGDNEEAAEQVKAVNRSADQETEALFQECNVIDACAYHLAGYNWQIKESGAAALCFNMLEAGDTSASGMIRQMAKYLEVIRKDPEHFMNVRSVKDIYEAKRTGKRGIILSAQTCDFISYKLVESYTELFARMGLRTMNLAYNHRTFAADGSRSGTNAGLSAQGKQLVKAMNRYGITIDLSHVGYASAMEAMELSETPVIYSHSNPLKLFPGARSITDEEAAACAKTGGVIGVSGYAPALWNGTDPVTIERFVDAIQYYAETIGIDHVGIGLDSMAEPGTFDPVDAQAMEKRVTERHEDSAAYWKNYSSGYGRMSAATIGLYGVAHHKNIVSRMLKRGFSQADIKRVMGDNMIRVFEKTWR